MDKVSPMDSHQPAMTDHRIPQFERELKQWRDAQEMGVLDCSKQIRECEERLAALQNDTTNEKEPLA